MRIPRELIALLACAANVPLARANTEIVNFAVSPDPEVGLALQTESWQTLLPHSPERQFSVAPAPLGTPIADVCPLITPGDVCAHQLWLALGTDEDPWKGFDKFTLRVSWPASSPAEFFIDIYSPGALSAAMGFAPETDAHTLWVPPPTRRMYARIRVVDTGVLTPASPGDNTTKAAEPVAFIVTLEPLYFGVLPGSVISTIIMLVVVAAVSAAFVVPVVSRHLTKIAESIRVDTKGTFEEKTRVD